MTARRIIAAVLAPGMAWAAPEGWPDLPAPETCEAVLTVQKANCDVEHVYRCPGGVQFNHLQPAKEGSDAVGYCRNAITGWTVESRADGVFILLPELAPFLDIGDVLAGRPPAQTGQALMWLPFFVDPMVGTMRGSFVEDASPVVIDGIELVKSRWDGLFSFNSGLLEFGGVGDVYIDAARGVSFSGKTEQRIMGATGPDPGDQSPVALVLPGEAGFLAAPDPSLCLKLGFRTPPTKGGRA